MEKVPEVVWERLTDFFGFSMPLGVVIILFIILFIMGVVFYMNSSSSLRKSSKALSEYYNGLFQNMTTSNEQLQKQNQQLSEQLEQSQARNEKLEDKIVAMLERTE